MRFIPETSFPWSHQIPVVVPHHMIHPVARGTLQLLHGSNVGGLDVLLESLNLLGEVSDTDLLILDDHVDLELADTVADGDKLRGTPDKAVHGDSTDTGLESSHVSLVIPGLDVESDDRLGGGLGTLGLLLRLVLSQALLADSDSLGVLLLIVATEQVDVIVLLGGSGGGSGGGHRLRAVGGVGSGGIAGEGGEVRLVAGDVLVPAGSVDVLAGVRGRLNGLEDSNIGLRSSVSDNVGAGGQPAVKDGESSIGKEVGEAHFE